MVFSTFKSKGVVFVELALVLIFLVPLLILTVDISYAFYEYQTIVRQVRSGARYLSVQAPGNMYSQREKAKCLVMTGVLPDDTSCPFAPLLHHFNDSGQVTINIHDSTDDTNLKSVSTQAAGNDSTTINLVKVSIEGYKHQLFSGLTAIQFGPVSCVMRQMN